MAAAALSVANGSRREWLAHQVDRLASAPARSEEQTVAAVGRASRALGNLGGRKKADQLRKEAEHRQRKEEEAERVRRQAEALATATASGTCSGAPQQPVG
eukprot:1157834-Prymnesium_polylepis.2